MAVKQREVYILPFPDVLYSKEKDQEDHPFIVLSCDESNDNNDNTFIGVMISGMKYKDDNSFELSDDMFDKPLAKPGCHVRMHLITLCIKKDILTKNPVNTMLERDFRFLMKNIGELIFNYKFSPAI